MKKTSIATFSRATATKFRAKGTILVENACLLHDLSSLKRVMGDFCSKIKDSATCSSFARVVSKEEFVAIEGKFATE